MKQRKPSLQLLDEPVGLIGAGSFGSALAQRLEAAGRPAIVSDGADVAEVCRAARLLLLVVSSRRARDVVPALERHVDGRHIIVHAIGALIADEKGEPRLRVSELLRRETAVRRIGVLAGPALAGDLREGRPAAMLVASPFDEVIACTQAALSMPPALRVYGSHDLVGAELASALAGAYTLGLGTADALELGPGPRALLITRAVAEATRLGCALGGEARTITGLAGLGNLLVRSSPGSSERSDDYQLGLAYGQGQRPERASEGLRSLPALVALAGRRGVRVPILAALEAATSGRATLAQVVAGLVEGHADSE